MGYLIAKIEWCRGVLLGSARAVGLTIQWKPKWVGAPPAPPLRAFQKPSYDRVTKEMGKFSRRSRYLVFFWANQKADRKVVKFRAPSQATRAGVPNVKKAALLITN
jgi:hypothetical protein